MKRPLVAISCLAAGTLMLLAAPPAWWSEEDTRIIDEEVENADNYAPANLGQLKHVATQAKKHLDAKLVGGADIDIATLVASFEPRAGQGYTQAQIDAFIAENYAPINLGQLKAVAKPFYDRLHNAGYNTTANLIAHGFPDKWSGVDAWTGYYPWDPETPVEENYAPANIGQLKMVFSFDLTDFDSDGDGMADTWEMQYFGNLGHDGSADSDHDGLTDEEEFQQGSDPTDYYSQGEEEITPVITLVSGDNQTAHAGDYLAEPFVVEVRNGVSGPLLEGAPVTFTVSTGGGGLAEFADSEDTSSTITVTTDEIGEIAAFYELGPGTFATNTVTAQAGDSTPVTFTSHSLPADDLWGHWRFNDASGTVAADSAQPDHDGTLTATPTWITRYMGEGAINFSGSTAESGSGAYVTMGAPTDGSLDFGGESFSVAVWVKFTETSTLSGSTGRRIVGKGDMDGGYFIGVEGDGKIAVGVGSSIPSTPAETLHFKTAEEFNDGEWHQVVVTIDQSEAWALIYVDGQLRDLEQIAGSGGVIDPEVPAALDFTGLEALDASATAAPLEVARHGTTNYFKGGVDDLRLYRRALSAAEVSALYQKDGPLTAMPQTVTLDEDTLGTITLGYTGGGGDAPTFTIVTPPTNGEAILEGGTVEYYPNAHYNGADTFRFRVTRSGFNSEADVAINVSPVDDPPLVFVGGPQSVTMPSSGDATASLSVTITDIDTDPEDMEILWTMISGPSAVSFDDTDPLNPVASFTEAGTYVVDATVITERNVRSDSLIIVVNPSTATNPPTAALQTPANNAAFALSAGVPISASATAASGRTIAKVEFYEGGSRKIGEDTTPDGTTGYYSLDWLPSRLGSYSLSVAATDSAGVVTMSTSRLVRVTQGGWFTGSGPGNQGYGGSGGNGGITEGSGSGPSGGYTGGGDGGGPTAGGGGNGMGGSRTDDSTDTDGDGLTDQEEKEAGTDPAKAGGDPDKDGVDDTMDAVPLDGAIKWGRVPRSKYAIVRIPETSTQDELLALGNDGSVLMGTRLPNGLYNALKVWKNGSWKFLSVSMPISYRMDVVGKAFPMNSQGDYLPSYSYSSGNITKAAGTYPITVYTACILDNGSIVVQGEFAYPDTSWELLNYGGSLPFSASWPAGSPDPSSSLLPKHILEARPHVGIVRVEAAGIGTGDGTYYEDMQKSGCLVERSGKIVSLVEKFKLDYKTHGEFWGSMESHPPSYPESYSSTSSKEATLPSGRVFSFTETTLAKDRFVIGSTITRSGFVAVREKEDEPIKCYSNGEPFEIDSFLVYETPLGNAYTADLSGPSPTSKIHVGGDNWTSTKAPLPNPLTQRGEAVDYLGNIWQNGIWKPLVKVAGLPEDDSLNFGGLYGNAINDKGVIAAKSATLGNVLLAPVEVKFTHILGKKYPALAPTFLLVNDKYGQPANGQLGHSKWGAASFSQNSPFGAKSMIKRWNYADTTLGGGGSCNSVSDSDPAGYNGIGGIQIDIKWKAFENKRLKIKFRLKSVNLNNHPSQPGSVSFINHNTHISDGPHVNWNAEKEFILDGPSPYKFSFEPNIGITNGDAEVQIDLEVEVISVEFVD